MEGTRPAMKLFLIGSPVRHSLSPAIYSAYFAHAGIEATYEVMEVPTRKELPRVIEWLRRNSAGFNVTIPHKRGVVALLDELSDKASTLGTVNAVAVVGGRLIGHNTDWLGFLRSLIMAGKTQYSKALVIGAGGAARAAVYALAKHGEVDKLVIVSRTGTTALALAKRAKEWGVPEALACKASIECLRMGATDAELIVNASPVGMDDPTSSPLPKELIPGDCVVLDMVYRPLMTRLLREAMGRGCRVIDGLWMLAHQAAENIRIWFGRRADPTWLRDAAISATGGDHDR